MVVVFVQYLGHSHTDISWKVDRSSFGDVFPESDFDG